MRPDEEKAGHPPADSESAMDQKSVQNSALIIAVLTSFMTPFMGSAINIALPEIAREFNMDAITLSWVATSFLLASVMVLVPFGRLADIYGRKKIFTYGILIFTIASLLSGLAFSGPSLILFRIFQGFGGSMIFATGIAILTSVFPPQERGRVLGINVAAVYLGLTLGPFLGGILTHYLTWRSVFLIHLPFGSIIIFLLLSKIKEDWADAKGESFDLIGSILYGAAILVLIYGLSKLPTIKGLWIFLLGFMGIVIFVRWEIRTRLPVFEVKLFTTNRAFAFSNLAALIHYCATFAMTFLLSLYFQQVKGLSPQSTGLILIAQPFMMAVFSPFAGRLSDRIEPRIVASIGMGVTTIGLVLLTTISNDLAVGWVVFYLALIGFGFALFSSPNTNAIMSSVERRFYGLASGAVGTMRQLGMIISMAIVTSVLSVLIGPVPISPDNYQAFLKGMKWAFMIFTVFCFVGIFASLSRGKMRNADELSKSSLNS